MKYFILLPAIIYSTSMISGQGRLAQTMTVKVFGNCQICKATIEKAGSSKNLSETIWDPGTQKVTIRYNPAKTNPNAILKRIALAGYDNEQYLAPDDKYNMLQSCCKYERKAKNPARMSSGADLTRQNSNNPNPGNLKTSEQVSPLNAVFDQYFNLKDALVKSDGKSAAAAAGLLTGSLEAVEMSDLKSGEHEAWMKWEKSLKMDASHIKDNPEIEHQREHFISLSSAMYELMKTARPSGTIYYQHCPMANDGKGANWLSRESTIKNPYYGSQMLSCGKTIETIGQ